VLHNLVHYYITVFAILLNDGGGDVPFQ